MKLDNYKNIKKTEWQELASQFGIKYEESSVVRYLVEKIAEKIGVDDKIVSDNELKKQVVDKINSDYQVIPVEEVKAEPTKKATTKKTPVKKDVKPKSPVIAKVESKKEVVAEIPVAELSRLEQLRLECESYGIAWSEIHTEQNLEQVLNGVKGAGVQPIKEMPTTEDYDLKWKSPDIDKITNVLVERHDFSSERVEATLSKLVKVKEEKKQKGLGDFF